MWPANIHIEQKQCAQTVSDATKRRKMKKTKAEIIENDIRKLFNKGCVNYGLLDDGDRILIGLSGGKDSLELIRLLAARARIWKPRIEVEAAHVIMENIPYESEEEYLRAFCEEQDVKLHVIRRSFDETTDTRKSKCFLCSWTRRKALFEFAAANGFNKVALGHHMDDILVTLLMNMTFESSLNTMTPQLKMEHYPITIIRPLCLVHEKLIAQLAEELHFRKQKKLCPYEKVSKREDMKRILHELEEINPEARYSMWGGIAPSSLPARPHKEHFVQSLTEERH